MAMRLKQLRVGTRLYAGFGVLIVLAVGGAGLAVERLAVLKSQLVIMSTVADHATRLDLSIMALETTRHAVLRFFIDADPAAATSVTDSLDKAADLLKQQMLDDTISSERRDLYQSVVPELRSYGEQFQRLVQLHGDAESLKTYIMATGDKLANDAAELVDRARAGADPGIGAAAAAALERSLMKQRVDGRGFRLTGDPSLRAAFVADRADTSARLDALERFPDEPIRSLAQGIADTYGQLTVYFDKAVAGRQEQTSLMYERMIPRVVAMQDNLTKARSSLQSYFRDTKRASDNAVAEASRMQIGATILSLVAGLAVAFVLGRGIIRPLKAITGTINRLVSGDTSADAPSWGRQDEIGDLARAVEVFRLNKIRGDNLAAQKAQVNASKIARQEEMDKAAEVFGEAVAAVMNTLMESASGMYHSAGEMTGFGLDA